MFTINLLIIEMKLFFFLHITIMIMEWVKIGSFINLIMLMLISTLIFLITYVRLLGSVSLYLETQNGKEFD